MSPDSYSDCFPLACPVLLPAVIPGEESPQCVESGMYEYEVSVCSHDTDTLYNHHATQRPPVKSINVV